MTITHYTVTGMTCGHCVNHVTEEVSQLPGVEHVDVTLEGGEMTIRSSAPMEFEAVRDAVAEAGDYTVTER